MPFCPVGEGEGDDAHALDKKNVYSYAWKY